MNFFNKKVISLAALTVVTAVPFLDVTPVLASWQRSGTIIADAVRRPDVKLNLSAAKKIVKKDSNGVTVVTWQDLGNQPTVYPGDLLRYKVTGKNQGNNPAKNLTVIQPVPAQTTYQLNSASSNNGAVITYSIDNGKTFVARPMVQVKKADGVVEERPAPAEAYTHIRWIFNKAIAPKSSIEALYEVKVR